MLEKSCKLCSKKRYANTSYCFRHWQERERKLKQEKAQRKKERKESTKKYQESLRKRLKNKAWGLMSQWIRTKDIDFQDNVQCYSCLRKFHWKEMHAGHRWHGKLDFDERNIHPQCNHCNTYIGGNLGEYERHLIQDYGLEWSNQLKRDAERHQGYSIQELKDIIEELKSKLL